MTPNPDHTDIAAFNVPSAVTLGRAPSIADTATVRDCRFGRYTQVNAHCRPDDAGATA